MTAKHRRPFDWTIPCANNEIAKASFHREAKRRLKLLAELLGWAPSQYDLRVSLGGPAVSGDTTLHHDHVYLQVSQGAVAGILIRACKGRKDFVGDTNTWHALALLDDLPALAARVGQFQQ